MYNERKERFGLKDILLQLSFIVLFVFLLVWLFPSKGFLAKPTKSITAIEFTQNITEMRDATTAYFTNERLPDKVGGTVKMTLGEMVEKKIMLPLDGKSQAACDYNASYVEIVREKTEYVFKVNLKCGAQEDYILVTRGCYDYCEDCVPTPKPRPKPIAKPTPIVYEYQFVKRGDGQWGDWSEYGAWTKTSATSSNSVRFETEIRNEVTGQREIEVFDKYVDRQVVDYYTTQRVQVGTNTILTGYEEQTTIIGTRQVITGYKTETVITGTRQVATGTYTSWTLLSRGTVYSTPQSNTTLREFRNPQVYARGGCGGCTNTINYVYDVYTRTQIYKTENITTTKQTPIYTTENITETKTVPVYKVVPVYEDRSVAVMKTIKEAIYKIVKEDVKGNVTYYRVSTRKYINGSEDFKWSKNNKDQALIDAGYSLTGIKREVK